ncbi:MAG: hypothetical protein JWP97_2854 [Labilithrix sp.]|nr:hypothetical protein [Labilithrix sp.]
MKSSSLAASLAILVSAGALASACSANETPPPQHADYDGGVGTALPCVPNLDGKIDSTELVPQIGVPASYLVSPSGKERQVDVLGQTSSEGKRTWSFGVDYADDQVAKVTAQSLTGKWYAESFTGLASPVVVALDVGGRTEGVYTQDPTGFYLHGVASVTPDAPEGKTLLVYETPVQLYRFPLENGAAWTSYGEVKNGTFRGLPFADKEQYDVKVDGSGEMSLPDFVLTQVLRVRTTVTISPSAGAVTTQRQVGWLFECLGEVARATSRTGETNDDFTTASELRRLGL